MIYASRTRFCVRGGGLHLHTSIGQWCPERSSPGPLTSLGPFPRSDRSRRYVESDSLLWTNVLLPLTFRSLSPKTLCGRESFGERFPVVHLRHEPPSTPVGRFRSALCTDTYLPCHRVDGRHHFRRYVGHASPHPSHNNYTFVSTLVPPLSRIKVFSREERSVVCPSTVLGPSWSITLLEFDGIDF